MIFSSLIKKSCPHLVDANYKISYTVNASEAVNVCRRSSTVEQLICNQQVGGSIPFVGSTERRGEVPKLAKGGRL
jgi:hypothetical protein